MGNQGGNLPVHQDLETRKEDETDKPDTVPKSVVDAWLKKARTRFGIRSIICLLDHRQLRLYLELKMDLISYDRASGDRPGPLVLPLSAFFRCVISGSNISTWLWEVRNGFT